MIYLAKALIKTDQRDEALDVLKRIMNITPDLNNYIEDSHYIHKGKSNWDEKF